MPSGERKLKRRLGGGNEAEEVQTPDVEFDKNCFNVEFNKTVYVRIARERERETEREILHWGKCLTKLLQSGLILEVKTGNFETKSYRYSMEFFFILLSVNPFLSWQRHRSTKILSICFTILFKLEKKVCNKPTVQYFWLLCLKIR